MKGSNLKKLRLPGAVIGALALAWFIIRVILKSSREEMADLPGRIPAASVRG